ncbi:hypothetical protein PMAYCL1PPCAC_08873, partial [Pristionchus mayeri]
MADGDPRKKPFECKACGHLFADERDLIRHQVTHLDDNDAAQTELKRPFKCDECDKRFSQSGNLKKHKTMHGK